MKKTVTGKDEKAILRKPDAAGQESLPAGPAIEEFVGEKADWSEDISQYEKDEAKGTVNRK